MHRLCACLSLFFIIISDGWKDIGTFRVTWYEANNFKYTFIIEQTNILTGNGILFAF